MPDKTAEFIAHNFKLIVTIMTFCIGLYIQHQANTAAIDRLQSEIARMNGRIDTQYQKLDAIKLDKSVFEATMVQIQTMSDDIREIRVALVGGEYRQTNKTNP